MAALESQKHVTAPSRKQNVSKVMADKSDAPRPRKNVSSKATGSLTALRRTQCNRVEGGEARWTGGRKTNLENLEEGNVEHSRLVKDGMDWQFAHLISGELRATGGANADILDKRYQYRYFDPYLSSSPAATGLEAGFPPQPKAEHSYRFQENIVPYADL
ncbi:hypothetical protein STEG23_002067 [Scotinomys teguina]